SLVGDHLRVLGPPAALSRVAAAMGVEDAVVIPDALPWETLHQVLTDAAVAPNGVRLHLSAGFQHLLTTGVQMSERNHVPLLTVKKIALSPAEAVVKRALDVTLACMLLAAFSPVMAVVALRLRVGGARGLLCRREMVGKHGRVVGMVTFRPEATRSQLILKLPPLVDVI